MFMHAHHDQQTRACWALLLIARHAVLGVCGWHLGCPAGGGTPSRSELSEGQPCEDPAASSSTEGEG
jgi:hypothetical protein